MFFMVIPGSESWTPCAKPSLHPRFGRVVRHTVACQCLTAIDSMGIIRKSRASRPRSTHIREGGRVEGRSCRLFDDEVVRHIMASAGVAVLDYLRQHKNVDEEEVCDFIDANAEMIIADTLDQMEGPGGAGDGGAEDEPLDGCA